MFKPWYDGCGGGDDDVDVESTYDHNDDDDVMAMVGGQILGCRIFGFCLCFGKDDGWNCCCWL